MPKATSGSATSSTGWPGQASPKAKSRPALPSKFAEKTTENKDYLDSNVKTRFWMQLDGEMFLLSIMQGPAAASPQVTTWQQYLRRVTVYMPA